MKQAHKLLEYGITDPDAQWGDYSLLRPWDGDKFRSSLRTAAKQSVDPDGNRAVMFSTTTDPYQVFTKAHSPGYKLLNRHHEFIMRKALELIRDESDFNVRILTRSGAAARHFELFSSFGNRLVFGMSLPTLNDKLRQLYEPDAPGVAQRLKTLQKAKEAGLNVYVAIAPTYPECDEKDLRATLEAVKKIEPITIFHEPINMRAENVQRIATHAAENSHEFKAETFASFNSWSSYAIRQLMQVQSIASELQIQDCLHLWPDPALRFIAKSAKANTSKQGFIERLKTDYGVPEADVESVYERYDAWIQGWWNRISEWPGRTQPEWTVPGIPSDRFLA
jgi:DNA repair photolyase